MSGLKELLNTDPAAAVRQMENSDGFAEVYPEDKYMIVRSLQDAHHVVGMTGDGVRKIGYGQISSVFIPA